MLWRYRLRTLFLLVTAVCSYCGYVAYRLDLERYAKGEFRTGTNYSAAFSTAEPVASHLRTRIGTLPGHSLTEDVLFEVPKTNAAFHGHLTREKLLDRFFCLVTLKDGTQTQVGFWVFENTTMTTPQKVGVSFELYAHDTYPDVLSGVAERRRKERFAFVETYLRIMSELRIEDRSVSANQQ